MAATKTFWVVGDITGLQTSLDAKAALASPAFTGTPSINADGSTNRVIRTASLTRTGGTTAGSNFNTSFAVGSTAQGPQSSDNAIYSEGFNINSTGQQATAGKVAIRWNFEENFYNTSISKYTCEWNFPSIWTTGGTEIRPFGGFAAHDGSYVSIGLAVSIFSIEDLSGNQYVEYSSSVASFKRDVRFYGAGDSTHYTSIIQSGSNGRIVQNGGGDLYLGNNTSHVRANGFTIYTGTTGIDWDPGAASFFSMFNGAKLRMFSDSGSTQKILLNGPDGSAIFRGQVTLGGSSTDGTLTLASSSGTNSIEYNGKWYIYLSGSTLFIRDLTNSRQHLEFNQGNSNTAAALKVNARMVVSGASDDGSTGLLLANGMDLQDCNVKLGTTTGTKWATAATQKQSWWGATPVVQQVLATGASKTVDDVISLLQTLGLCKQS